MVFQTALHNRYSFFGLSQLVFVVDSDVLPIFGGIIKKLFALTLLASSSLAGPVFAADMPLKARQAVIVDSWAGIYGGVFAGARISKDDWSSDESVATPNGFIGAFKSTDFSGGLLSGVNIQSGKIVWGPELDTGFTSQSKSMLPPTGGFLSANEKTRYDSHLRLRAGYDMGQFMPFVAAGAAFADSRFSGASGTSSRWIVDRAGVTIGGGVDWRFAPSWIARVEYLHDQYAPIAVGTTPVISNTSMFDLKSDTVRAALIYKWGNGSVSPVSLFTKAPVATGSWSGVYLGAFAGGHWSRDRATTDESGFANVDLKNKGFAGGGLIGANFQQGNLVWGLELDAGGLGGSGQSTAGNGPGSSMRADAHARVRFGYDFGPFMPFTAGGIAFADTRVNELGNTKNPTLYRMGTSFGAGVDWAIAPHWIARVEYLYDVYANASYGISNEDTFSLTNQTLRAALMYKFDALGPRPAPVYAKAPAAIQSGWTGTYAGLFAGGHFAKDRWDSDETFPGSSGSRYAKASGFSGGGLAGANLQLGSFVVGTEADIGGLTGKGDTGAPTITIQSSQSWDAHARLRFGYDAGQWMPFLAGGAAFTQAKVDATTINFHKNIVRAGATVGGGIDWAFSPSWIARIEYLHDQYAPSTVNGLPGQFDSENFQLKNDTVRAAIIYKN